nr:hypothetical protein [Bifidobacterium avesanii]
METIEATSKEQGGTQSFQRIRRTEAHARLPEFKHGEAVFHTDIRGIAV